MRVAAGFCRAFALCRRCRTASCLCRLRGCRRGTALRLDASLAASSFEADADDADDAAELADDAAAVSEDSARVSDAFAFVSDVLAAEADLAAAVACSVASPAFVVAAEADDAALSADFPAAVALAEASSALTDASRDDDAAAVSEPAAAEALVPLPFQKTWRSSQTSLPPSRNFLPPLPRKLRYRRSRLRSFLMILPPLLRPPHPWLTWRLLTLSWSRWMQTWRLIL
ncbi:hypothetical protein ACLBR5_20720 [Escherichia coli]